jgi:hypothetical protein
MERGGLVGDIHRIILVIAPAGSAPTTRESMSFRYEWNPDYDRLSLDMVSFVRGCRVDWKPEAVEISRATTTSTTTLVIPKSSFVPRK